MKVLLYSNKTAVLYLKVTGDDMPLQRQLQPVKIELIHSSKALAWTLDHAHFDVQIHKILFFVYFFILFL